MRAPLTGTPRKDGRWQIVVALTRPDGAKVRKCFIRKTQREVQAAARELLAHNPKREAASDFTVTDLLDYCEHGPWKKLSARTLEQYAHCGTRIKEKFAMTKVSDLSVPIVYQWCHELSDVPTLSGRSVQIHRSVLRVALQEAVFLGWINANPAAGWKLPSSINTKPKKRRRMTPEEVESVISFETDTTAKMFFRVLYETGGRPSEICSLSEKHVVKVDGLGWWIDLPGTKTDAAPRMVPISKDLACTLLNLPEPWFTYSRRQWTEVWHRAQVRMGWRAARTNKQRGKADEDAPTLYGIRKVRITLWKEMGVEDEVWIALAGHENVDLTRETYDRPTLRRIHRQLAGE